MLAVIVVVFALGYLAIAFEHPLRLNKTATAMLMGTLCWALYAIGAERLIAPESIPEVYRVGPHPAIDYLVEGQLLGLTGEIAGILFFLMGAMTIVELIDANEGFSIITERIRARNKTTLLWLIGFITFFLSSVLDNLTTTIVMISLLRKLLGDKRDRMIFAGLVVIAANAGGAWTVIGDVTTTMLWIKGKITAVPLMGELFLTSLTCLIVPLIGMSYMVRGTPEIPGEPKDKSEVPKDPQQKLIFLVLGLAGLLSVPFFKAVTHLPPYLGMMMALSVLWLVSEFVHAKSDEKLKTSLGLLTLLKRIDMSSVLFFLGILLAVGCLGSVGVLRDLAYRLDEAIGNRDVIAVTIGFVSAVVDNVPLVAAGIEMYQDPVNARFWMLLAYCAGTGGSCLIIGSAAGVAAMGMERIDFLWYVRNISLWATLGYLAGVGVFFLQSSLMG